MTIIIRKPQSVPAEAETVKSTAEMKKLRSITGAETGLWITLTASFRSADCKETKSTEQKRSSKI